MPGMLKRRQAQLQYNAYPTNHQTHVDTGDPVPTGAGIFWGQLRGPQNPLTHYESLNAVEWR